MLWALSTDDFQMITSRQPGLRRSLGRNVRARLSRTDQMQAVLRLSQMPIFAQLPPATIQAIAQRMVLQHVPAGERVYRIGEVGDAMYLVENGEIELTAENAMGVVEEIGRIGPESHFGELSLLTGQIRTKTPPPPATPTSGCSTNRPGCAGGAEPGHRQGVEPGRCHAPGQRRPDRRAGAAAVCLLADLNPPT